MNNWCSGFQSSSYFILYPYIKTTVHPHPPTLIILNVTGFHITRLPHTKSNLQFYQKWIAGLIHYHISHCTSFSTGKSGFCSSLPCQSHECEIGRHGFVIMVCSELGLHRELAKKAAQNRANFGYQKCIHPLSDS